MSEMLCGDEGRQRFGQRFGQVGMRKARRGLSCRRNTHVLDTVTATGLRFELLWS